MMEIIKICSTEVILQSGEIEVKQHYCMAMS